MARIMTNRWMALVALNVVLVGVLGFLQRPGMAQRPVEPFAPAANQRTDLLVELREIKSLIQEQNNLLRGGKIKVIVEK